MRLLIAAETEVLKNERELVSEYFRLLSGLTAFH